MVADQQVVWVVLEWRMLDVTERLGGHRWGGVRIARVCSSPESARLFVAGHRPEHYARRWDIVPMEVDGGEVLR